jgi:hypothetical protein
MVSDPYSLFLGLALGPTIIEVRIRIFTLLLQRLTVELWRFKAHSRTIDLNHEAMEAQRRTIQSTISCGGERQSHGGSL